MKILDEGLVHQITYSPECQATFAKYKQTILRAIVSQLAILVVGFVLFYFAFMSGDGIEKNGILFPSLLLIGSLFLFLLFQFNSLRDLRANRLDIQEDIFLNLKVSQTENGTEYNIQLKNAGHLGQPPTIRRIQKNAKVYVVRTAVTKTLLDIVPIDEIKS